MFASEGGLMSFIRWGLLIAALLMSPGWAQGAPVLQTIRIPFVPGQPPLQLKLPEGYSLRTVDGFDGEYVFCPWNEFFNLRTYRFPLSAAKSVPDDKAMTAQLDAFTKATPTIQYRNQKVWMTPQGPRGWLESVSGVKPKEMIGCHLFVPRGSELLVLRTMGTASSLADQKVIQDLFQKELIP